MKRFLTCLAFIALTVGSPAAASAPDSPSGPTQAPALSVQTTPIGDILKNSKARAVVENAVPEMSAYYDQISSMTLAEVAPLSQGHLDQAKLEQIQSEFDRLSAKAADGRR